MLEDKKIKRKINEAMKPDLTFCEFCEKHEIKINTASNIKQNNKRGVKFAKIFVPTAMAVVIFLGIFLPLQLPKLFGTTPNDSTPKLYGELSVDKTAIDIGQIHVESNVLLFNMENVEDISEINRISPKEDSGKLLGYHIKNVLYGFYVDNELYAYDFDYLIRSYKNYKFYQEDLFEGLDKNVTVNNRFFSYTIQNEITGRLGYIRFIENEIEYFISLRAFNNVMEINDENIISFLRNIYTEEAANEKIDYRSE